MSLSMKVDNFKVKKIGDIDVSEWVSVLNDEHINTLFTKYTFRQKKYIRQTNTTKTLPLIWTRNDTTFEEDEFIQFKFEEMEIFKDKLDKVLEILNNAYPDCIPSKIMLAKLLKRSLIMPHIDDPPIVKNSHRTHTVLITNEKVIFKVDNEPFKMKVGEMYEINNARTHGVINGGNTDRIHLIIDMLPRSYIKDTTTIRDIMINGSNIDEYEM